MAFSDVVLLGTGEVQRPTEEDEDEEAPGDWLPGTGTVQVEATCVLDEVWIQFVLVEDEEQVMGALLMGVNGVEEWVLGGPVIAGDGEGAAFA